VSRVSRERLVVLADAMPVRDRAIVEAVARLSLLSGAQVTSLFFSSHADRKVGARLTRRVLARLVDQRVLHRLERPRRGGAGGGSSSWVYALGPAGQRILAYWAGEGLPRSRSAHEPGVAWAAHTLAVSDLYVRLKQAERDGLLELLAFDAEPACHRRYTRLGGVPGVLKPDAFVRLGVPGEEWEDAFFIEADLASERRGQLTRQFKAYVEYFRSGQEQARTGVFPAALWVVPDQKRARLLSEIQHKLPEQARRLFMIATREHAIQALLGQSEHEPLSAGGVA
jgi:hypothetical protein